MSLSGEELYSLLPSIYRTHDAEHGYKLKALLSVIAEQAAILDDDIQQLYEDLFIETCSEWVIPYIGDLIGAQEIYSKTKATFSKRAQVANTLAYRRRKGTVAILEQLAKDVTGWDARVVEFFKLLATTQYMKHLRPDNTCYPNLRRSEPLGLVNTPFESLYHTVDVRNISSHRGRYNIRNLGIFLWRLRSYPLTNSPPVKISEDGEDRRYLFSPLGNNIRLYTKPLPEGDIGHIAIPENLPLPITRQMLRQRLNVYYGVDRSITLHVGSTFIEPNDITVCDLSNDSSLDWPNVANIPEHKYAIDPELGRLVLPEDMATSNLDVRVSFHYGFSADMSGGEYDREGSFAKKLKQVVSVPEKTPNLQDALTEIESGGAVEISDNGRYHYDKLAIKAKGSAIELRAANKKRPILKLNDEMQISGEACADGDGAEISLNGLLICGRNLKVSDNIKILRLHHCTLVPGLALDIDGRPTRHSEPSLVVESDRTIVDIDKCIIGGIRVSENSKVNLLNSIVDATRYDNVAYAAPLMNQSSPDDTTAGGELEVNNCTIIGRVHTFLIKASNSIFLADQGYSRYSAPVKAERLQDGCVRFCYMPLNSQVPRRYQCQPIFRRASGNVRPEFKSLHYGDESYCQLGPGCHLSIRQGAEDESEIGAFHDLYQPQKEANLCVRLNEHLRFGLEAGVIYES